jgi:thiol-disulfide isomerase/thioredoxin
MSMKKNKGRMNRGPIITVVVLMSAVATGCSMLGEGGKTGSVEVTSTPSMTDSVKQALEPFRGKVVILDIWATWCGPCRMEIPDFVKLQDKYRDRGLQVVGISIDPLDTRGGGAAAVAPFVQKYGINYTVLMVKSYDALSGYPPGQGIPTTYVLDREGRIVRTYVGARPGSVFEEDVKQLL